MIIKELELSNFRQFYGSQNIIFASGDKNITLIQGNNGAGKTSIYRALMFVLYGDISLKQDDASSDLNLVNLDALEEGDGMPVTSYVNLKFINDGVEYELKRKIKAVKDSRDHITTRQEDPILHKFTKSGDYIEVSSNKDQVQRFINSIVAPEIKEFFFYDAEQMNLLDPQSAEKSMSEDIKKGVMNILQIEYLKKSVAQIELEIKAVNSKIRKMGDSDKELSEKYIQLRKVDDQITRKEEERANNENELNNMKDEFEALNLKLGASAEKNHVIENIKNYEALIIEKEDNITEKKRQMKSLLNNAAVLYGMDMFLKHKPNMESILADRPDRVPEHFLSKSLEDGKCYICNSNINSDSAEHRYIMNLLKEYESKESTKVYNSILQTGSRFRNNEKYQEILNKAIRDIEVKKKEIEEIQLEIDTLVDKYNLDGLDSEEITKLNESLEAIKRDIAKSEQLYSKLEDELILLEKNKAKLELDIDKLESKKEIGMGEKRSKDALVKIKDAINQTIDDYSMKMINDLAEETNSTFRQLINEENLYFKNIEINDRYQISVKNYNNEEIIQDLSAGQKQLLSLSFVLSLAKIAAKGVDGIEFPLFMDTPFARLSSENRENVIRNIPMMTDQWILLLTDTEFTSDEKIIFDQGSRVGKFYYLNKNDGKTTIEKRLN